MITDSYGLPLSTTSRAAADAYVEGCGLMLTLYPGAVAAFDRAIAEDPGFAAAYVAKARALQTGGDMAGAKAALALAEARSGGVSPREAGQIGIFRLILDGRPDAAFEAVRAHLDQWPRDALALSTSASQTGLIALSGRAGRDWELARFLDGLAVHYGDDWWFTSHHGMALSETGQQEAARPKLERSLAQNPRNASVAHGWAHFCYENGDHAGAIAFLRSWLADYPRTGLLYGHLSWHLAICELESGDLAAGARLYRDAFAAEDYSGPALFKLFDAVSFLWRSELAGHPRDAAPWRAMHAFAHQNMPRPGMAYADWHVALADAVAGDGAGIAARLADMSELVNAGRYPAGAVVLGLSQAFVAFEQGDFSGAIDILTPLMAERERIGGSRAQIDLVEFTLMKAYLALGRADAFRAMAAVRRPGPKGIPIAGAQEALAVAG